MDNGVLLEEWDDDAQVYGELAGGKWVTRPYTPGEIGSLPTPAGTVQSDLDDLTVAILAAL